MNLSRRHFLAGTAVGTALGTGVVAWNSTAGLEDSQLVEQTAMKPQTTVPGVSVDDIHKLQAEIQSGLTPSGGSFEESVSGLMPQRVSYTTKINNVIQINPATIVPEEEIIISAGLQGLLTRLRVNAKDRNGAEILDANGKPVKIKLKEGHNVSKGQEIGTIDDSVELDQIAAAKAMLEVAIAEEEKTIEVDFAKAAWAVATSVVERNILTNKMTPNTIPAVQLIEDQLKKVQAEKQYEKAYYDLNVVRPAETNVKRRELAIAQTRLRQRRLFSPVDGIVEEIRGREGMWFREGQEILKITQYDPLLVKSKVNIHHATPSMIDGKSVDVIVQPLENEERLQFTGKVIFASQSIEADEHFTIHVEVKNQLKDGYWILNPGRFVELRIKL